MTFLSDGKSDQYLATSVGQNVCPVSESGGVFGVGD